MNTSQEKTTVYSDKYLIFVGEIITYLRQNLKLTLKDLASRSGLSYSYLSAIENGRRSPDLKVMAKIASALDTPLHKIIQAADNMEFGREKVAKDLNPILLRMSEIYRNLSDEDGGEDRSDEDGDDGSKGRISSNSKLQFSLT